MATTCSATSHQVAPSVTAANPLDAAACAVKNPLVSRLLVAAGGGGGGGASSAPTAFFGGGGGPAAGGGGDGDAGSAPAGGTGGGAGTASAGGVAGQSSDSTAAVAGTLGQGGAGGWEVDFSFGGGGGGGGGVFGEGGGGGGKCVPNSTSVCGAGGGGGGGSSGVPAGVAGVTGLSVSAAAAGATPSASFSWTLPAPTALTGAASQLAPTRVTLNGTVDPNGSVITGCHFTLTPKPLLGASIPCAQSLGGGAVPTLVSAAVSGLTPATTYAVTLMAASAQGTTTGQRVSFTTPTAGTRSTTLQITKVSESHSRWRRGSSPAVISRAHVAPIGTTFAFTLNQKATARVAFSHVLVGQRGAGHRCVAPTVRNRHAATCQRVVSAGSLSFGAHAGANAVRFFGRLADSVLARGSYAVAITATAAGRHASASLPRFTIVG